MKRSEFPFLGFGVGLRRQHYGYVLDEHPKVDLFEAISENFMVRGGRPLCVLEKVRERYPIALHGVSMSIGSTDPLNREYRRRTDKAVPLPNRNLLLRSAFLLAL
jgi:uncharacterized protein